MKSLRDNLAPALILILNHFIETDISHQLMEIAVVVADVTGKWAIIVILLENILDVFRIILIQLIEL
jgi:hypothetical protein